LKELTEQIEEEYLKLEFKEYVDFWTKDLNQIGTDRIYHAVNQTGATLKEFGLDKYHAEEIFQTECARTHHIETIDSETDMVHVIKNAVVNKKTKKPIISIVHNSHMDDLRWIQNIKMSTDKINKIKIIKN